jgi:CRP-like cAMP-binding protein
MDVCSWQQFTAGNELITTGEKDRTFFVIASEDVGVTVQGKEICIVKKGECVGELGYLAAVGRPATVAARSDVNTIKVDAALMEWASIPVQIRFNRAFQQILIGRLTHTTHDLASRMD